jgi:hydroxyethylthiazole kinase-like uncharacterized protein yjeF
MHSILTPEKMRLCDSYAIETLSIPAAILMEDAAHATFERARAIVQEHFPNKHCRILIFCGSGNNGGDGFALARMLTHRANTEVRVVWIGAIEKMSSETVMNFHSVQKHGIPLQHVVSEEDIAALAFDADCVIDALVGIGGNEHPRGVLAMLLEKISQTETFTTKPFTIAIDVPTGLNAETGKAHQHCIRANFTITLAALKTGLLLNDAREMCGEIVVVPIGIPQAYIAQQASIYALEPSDVRRILPPRPHHSTKHSYGSVAVIGGTSQMAGAPTLTANASISAGAGLVRLYSPNIHNAVLPEVMTTRLVATERGGISLGAKFVFEEAITQNDVFVLGMGLGTEAESLAMMRWLLENIPPEKPIVLDADGLRVLRLADGGLLPLRANIVCTPHRGEFARLTGEDYAAIPERAHILAPEWASRLGCVMLLKNVPSIISNGVQSYWNMSGNAGLATAGSGDVLSGIIGAMLAQGVKPLEAAALGAFLHGTAGDVYVAQFSQETLTASRIITALQEVFA